MADTKISALTALANADDDDVLPIVDVSASTTKKIRRDALLGTATATELSYVDGVTSNIQTQINAISRNLVLVGTYTAISAEATKTFSFSQTFNDNSEFIVIVRGICDAGALEIWLRINADAGATNYETQGNRVSAGANTAFQYAATSKSVIATGNVASSATTTFVIEAHIMATNVGGQKASGWAIATKGGGAVVEHIGFGHALDDNPLTDITILTDGGNWSIGTQIQVYRVLTT